MRADEEVEVVRIKELLDDVRAERERHAAVILGPPGDRRVGVGPHEVAQKAGVRDVGRPFDHAVSAFIEDVEARGLRDKILLVCCGEMGRTPKVNAKAGRDHWGGSAPLMLYGGGLKMGQVIGSSTKDGGEPASDRVTIPNLYATLMEQLLDTGAVRAMAGIPNEVNTVISGASPIKQLL